MNDNKVKLIYLEKGTSNGDLLVFDATQNTWVSKVYDVADMPNNSIINPQDGDVLTYDTNLNSGLGGWRNIAAISPGNGFVTPAVTSLDMNWFKITQLQAGVAGSTDAANMQQLDGKANISHTHVVADITDIVFAFPPNDGDVLTYNASGGIWEAKTPTGGSGSLDDYIADLPLNMNQQPLYNIPIPHGVIAGEAIPYNYFLLNNLNDVNTSGIADGYILQWNATNSRWDAVANSGSFTETDPIFTASDVYGVTTADISNWDSAFSWGDHSLAGYAQDSEVFKHDGSIAMTGDLDMGGHSIINLSATSITFVGGAVMSASTVDTIDTAIQPSDISTLTKVNNIIGDATLIDTNDPRLSDARTPLSHTHIASEVTDFDTEVSNNIDVVANIAKVGITTQQASDIIANNAKVTFPGFTDLLTDYSFTDNSTQWDALVTASGSNGYVPLNSSNKIDATYYSPVAIVNVTVDGTETSFTNWVTNNYVGNPTNWQNGDVVIGTTYTQSWINNGGSAGDATDWNEILTPQGGAGISSVLHDSTLSGDGASVALTVIDDMHYHSDASITSLNWSKIINKPDPTITLGGDATGSVTLTDLTNGTLTVVVVDDSHNHIISNVDGLQTELDGKATINHTHDDRYYTETELSSNISGQGGELIGIYKTSSALDSFTGTNVRDVMNSMAQSISDSASSLTSIIAGTGLSGGGDLTADRTFDLNAATALEIGGIKSGADISVDTSGNAQVNNDSHSHTDATVFSLDWSKIINKPDPTITLGGDLTGNVTLTDVGDGTLTAAIVDDSHNHTDTTLTSLDWSKILNKPDPAITLGGDLSGSVTLTDLANGTLNATIVKDSVITLSGDVTGNATMTDLGDVGIACTVVDDSHNHIISNVDNLQNTLDSKIGKSNNTNVTFALETNISTLAINWLSNQKQAKTISASSVFTFSSPPFGAGNLLLRVQHNGTGHAITFSGITIKWQGGSAPDTTNSADGSSDIFTFYWPGSGTTYYCSYANFA